MPLTQAVILIDRNAAQIHTLAAPQTEHVNEHQHHIRQHGSNVGSEHEFFSDVCDALQAFTEIFVRGSYPAQADFRRYVEKHRPALAAHLIGWETVDHPSPGQALAGARIFFAKHDRMVGRQSH